MECAFAAVRACKQIKLTRVRVVGCATSDYTHIIWTYKCPIFSFNQIPSQYKVMLPYVMHCTLRDVPPNIAVAPHHIPPIFFSSFITVSFEHFCEYTTVKLIFFFIFWFLDQLDVDHIHSDLGRWLSPFLSSIVVCAVEVYLARTHTHNMHTHMQQ